MRHLGFPLDSELHPGKAVIYVDPDVGMRSCTKGGGDLNSLEFCLDEFPPADVKSEIISTVVQVPRSAPELLHTSTMQIDPDNGPAPGQNLIVKDNCSIVNVHEKSHENTQNEDVLDENPQSQRTSSQLIADIPSTEEEHSASSMACDGVFQSQSSGILDVNAQEFIPGSAITSEVLGLPCTDSTSAPVSLSASAKEFFPSSSYPNLPPVSLSSNAPENQLEARKCARCNKVRYALCK